MITNKDSLKEKLRNLSEKTNVPSNYLLQSFMFEGLLKRVSFSKYKEQFIIKGFAAFFIFLGTLLGAF